jgi:hypothetical protein
MRSSERVSDNKSKSKSKKKKANKSNDPDMDDEDEVFGTQEEVYLNPPKNKTDDA